MKIVSWNVNGIRAAANKGFLDWLAVCAPDILCVQETKAEPGQLPESILSPCDKNGNSYASFWASAKKRGYSGTAVFTKQKPLDVSVLGDDAFDGEGRVLKADYGDFVIISAYFPNSQDAGARLPYKLEFCNAMLSLCKKFSADGRDFILCGDYNIAHRPIDLARPKENEGNAGYLPEERAWMDSWISSGFVDTFRAKNGDIPHQYTWWSYRAGARERNVGWRLDYQCVPQNFLPRVERSSILKDVYGSDHCPVEIVIQNNKND